MRKAFDVLLASLLLCAPLAAQEPKPIDLPAPQMQGGKPLMQALRERQSQREFSREKLPPQVLSNLLWAAFGVSRPDSGKRTAPSAMNRQDMLLYVALAEGLFLYDAKGHRLTPVAKDDLRALTGTQPFAAEVPVDLIYVAPLAAGASENEVIFGGSHAGFIAENVYLFCASEGLATVVRASLNREALAKAMGLPADRKIILAQSVGYPKR